MRREIQSGDLSQPASGSADSTNLPSFPIQHLETQIVERLARMLITTVRKLESE